MTPSNAATCNSLIDETTVHNSITLSTNYGIGGTYDFQVTINAYYLSTTGGKILKIHKQNLTVAFHWFFGNWITAMAIPLDESFVICNTIGASPPSLGRLLKLSGTNGSALLIKTD